MKTLKTSGVIVGLAGLAACGIMAAYYLLQRVSGDSFAAMMTPRKWLFYFIVAVIGWLFGLVIWPHLVHSNWLRWLIPNDAKVAHKVENCVCLVITLGLVVALTINPLWLTSKLFVAVVVIFLCYFCCQAYRGKVN